MKMDRRLYSVPGGFISRILVSLGSILWAVDVLIREDALANRFYVYRQMVYLFHEDRWAMVILFMSLIGLYRCLFPKYSHWTMTAVSYGSLMVFWVYIDAVIVTVDLGIVSPAGLAGVTVIAVSSIVAAASTYRP